jgi:peptide/nickel transport system permease protein
MTAFAGRRFLQMALLLLAMSFAVFCLIGLMPGDPVDLMAAGNPRITPEDLARLRAVYGLDQPLMARYLHWLKEALHGDFGYSRLYGLPVPQVILPRLLHTLVLLGTALALTVIVAIPAGVLAARWRGGWYDRAAGFAALAGLSAPPFWIALLGITLFSAMLGWLPASADMTNPLSLVLPVLTLTLAGLAVYVRHTRGAMVEALKAPHIRTARAKGCTERRVVWVHAFRNALAPVLTIFMLDLGTLCGGAVTIETVFAFPGMGKLMFDAVQGNDYNLALVAFLMLTALVFLMNFLADVAYALLDPRIGVAK